MQNRQEASLTLSPEDIDLLLEIYPHGVCAFDFEMTGLSPVFDKIIEIAAVKINPDKSLDTFHSLVNPLIEIPPHTIPYHGLENEDLRDAPSIKVPLRKFHEFYGNLPLIAHSAMFDASFLIRALHQFNLKIGLSDVLDSCRLARVFYKKKEPAPQNFKLNTLATYFNLDFTHHQALDDALACLKIFAVIAKQIPPEKRASELKNLSFLFKLIDFQKRESYTLPKKLNDLELFLKDRTPIEIAYQGGKNKGDFRPVRPIAILPLPQGLVLYGECLQDNMNKYFQTKKIKQIREIE